MNSNNNNNNIRTLADFDKNISQTSNNESVFNTTSGHTLSGNTVKPYDVDPEFRSALDIAVDECKKYNEENPNSSDVDESSLYESDISEIESANEGIFQIVHNIFREINENGLVNYRHLGDTPNSISLSTLIEYNSTQTPFISNILSNINSNNNNIIRRLNLSDFNNWRDITLGQLVDNINNLPAYTTGIESIDIKFAKIIPFGMIYHLLMRNFMKEYNNHFKLDSKVYSKLEKIHLSKTRLSTLCIMGGFVIPISAAYISHFTKTSIFDGIKLNLKFSYTTDSLFSLPLLLYNKLNNNTEGVKEEKNTQNKILNFMNGWGKWFIFIILVYLEYKFDIINTMTSGYTFYFFAYYIYILVSISLVWNSLAILILTIENKNNLDVSKFKFKWIIKSINSYLALKNSGVDPKLIQEIRLDHIRYLKITLFVLFTFPVYIWLHLLNIT